MARNQFDVDGVEELLDALNQDGTLQDIKTLVRHHGSQVQRDAQRRAPKDTGQLRQGIRLEIKDGGLTSKVTSSVNYSKYVEYGTIRMSAQPYMRPSLQHEKPKFLENIIRLLEG